MAVSFQPQYWGFNQWHPATGGVSTFYNDFRNSRNENGKYYYQDQADRYHGFPKTIASYVPWMLSLSLLRDANSAEVIPNIPDEGPLKILHEWKQLSYEFSNDVERNIAISSKKYVPENNLPLGLETWNNKIFVTVPRWKPGVPATLTWIPKSARRAAPLLKPYPNWDFHEITESCTGLTSVFRVFADSCDRLWVLDSGQINVLTEPKQVCPPSVFIFDLRTDQLIMKYELPSMHVKQDSLYTNIVVDIREGRCNDAFAYLTDVWRFGVLVFDFKNLKSWRVTHGYFYPDPLYTKYQIDDLVFRWTDGIFGMALGPYDKRSDDRLIFFHPMSSSNEFFFKTSLIRNESNWNEEGVSVLGQSRGPSGHSSASGMDRNGIMFSNYVTRNSIGCWDSRKPYNRDTQGIVAQNNYTLVFPNDLKIDHENRQSLWILSNKLPFYLYRKLDKNDVNFRIMSGFTDELVKNTICDPKVSYKGKKLL